MESKEEIREKNYQKSKKKIIRISILVFLIGLFIGSAFIITGISKQKTTSKEKEKANLQEKIDTEKKELEKKAQELEEKRENNLAEEKKKLEDKKKELEAKGIKYSTFAEYTEGEKYDLKIVTEALDPSFRHCSFPEYSENALTKDYCALFNKTDEDSKKLNTINCALNSTFDFCGFSGWQNDELIGNYCSYKQQLYDYNTLPKQNHFLGSLLLYILGAGVIIISMIIAGAIYIVAKKRDIMAFSLEQERPILEERRKMVQKMKEENLPAVCPRCGAPTNKKIVCEYCGCKMVE